MILHRKQLNTDNNRLKSTKTKAIAAIGTVAVLLSVVAIYTRPAQADQFDAQINALNAQIAQNQAAANQKAAEANTLANKVAQLNAQIAAATADLNKTNVEIAKTNAEIDAANKDLDRQKNILKDNLRTIYKQGEVSPIEVVASSKDLSDFVAQQEYLSAIKKKIDANLKKIDALKKELDEKKSNLVTLQTQQQAKADNVASQKAQQADLLAQTQGDEAKYKGIAAAQSAQVASLKAQQQAAFARIYSGGGGSINTGSTAGFSQCGGGYPSSLCNAPQDALVDQWGLYNRECVSYAAWAMQYRFGHHVPHFNGHGNAYEWPSYLGSKGYRVDHTPEVGSVAIANIGGYGHAMVVEQVLSPTQVRVSQYNWWPSASGPGGLYSTMTVGTSGLTFIHF